MKILLNMLSPAGNMFRQKIAKKLEKNIFEAETFASGSILAGS